MPGFVREHIRPLAGAVGLHALLFALIVATAWRWSSSRPPVPMAIEGVAVDARSLPKELLEPRPRPASPELPAPEPEPVAPTPAPAPPDDSAERAREADAQAERERAAEAAREQAALEARRAEEAERTRQQKLAAEEASRKAAEAEARRRKEAEAEAQRRKEAERRKVADEARRKETAEQQAREAELRRSLEAEEAEGASIAASGVIDQYRAELEQAIERSWIRPPSAQPGLVCTLYVTQAPGGTVLNVRLGSCNGDAAVRESITNAVFRASPLPAPSDPRAFARSLEIVFRPTE
jgi:colicin import membrane protein